MKIVWSPLAIRRAVEAAEYIARDKPEAAARWAKSVFTAVERLEDHPESGRVVPELGRSEVREVIHGTYRIIYRLEGIGSSHPDGSEFSAAVRPGRDRVAGESGHRPGGRGRNAPTSVDRS